MLDVKLIGRRWRTIPTGKDIDERARKYAAAMHKTPFDDYRQRAAAMDVGGERMLDAGCGVGTWSFAFAPLFRRVDGCDIMAPRVALARRLAVQFGMDNLYFQKGDVLALPFDDAAFDFVFCNGVVISSIPIRDVLGEFARVLRPGGKLYVCLNGIGWSMYLRDGRGRSDFAVRETGILGLYNTITHSRVDVTPTTIRHLFARIPRKSALRADSAADSDPSEIIAAFAAPPIVEMADLIAAECGEAYRSTFANDLLSIGSGERDDFAHADAGRGYSPDFIGEAVRASGFTDLRWAPEGRLFAIPEHLVPPETSYHGHLKTWEFVATRTEFHKGDAEIAPDRSVSRAWNAVSAILRLRFRRFTKKLRFRPFSRTDWRSLARRELAAKGRVAPGARLPAASRDSPGRASGSSAGAPVELLKYPFPFKSALAISNDIDGMTWPAFLDWHAFVNGTGDTPYGKGLGLEVGDSFWVWCHSTGGPGEFALYKHTPFQHGTKTREHDEILELARLGWLDTLHGFGDWRDREPLPRSMIGAALEYLAGHGVRPRTYVNHGGLNMSHNIGGFWGHYQWGDDPQHPSYCLDLLLSSGFRYFWTDIMHERDKFGEQCTWESAQEREAVLAGYRSKNATQRFVKTGAPSARKGMQPGLAAFGLESTDAVTELVFDNILLPVRMRDGNRVFGFKRYRGEYPSANTASFAHQVNPRRLDTLVAREAVAIIYQHFGVWKSVAAPRHYPYAKQYSRSPLLDENAVWAFRMLAERQDGDEIFITTTSRLLEYLRVRDNLRYRLERTEDTLRIVLVSVDCPVYGTEPVTPANAQGLSFLIQDCPPNVVITDESGRALPATRATEYRSSVVSVPWKRLTWPL